jgi:hypothetical protein
MTKFLTVTFYFSFSIAQALGASVATEHFISTASPDFSTSLQLTHLFREMETNYENFVPVDVKAVAGKWQAHVTLDSATGDGAWFVDPEKTQGELTIVVNPLVFSSSDFPRLLTHEMFHLIHYLVHKNEPAWIREGLAQNFEFIVYQKLNLPNIKAAFQGDWVEMTSQYDLANPDRRLYGRSLLYFSYLIRECGGTSLFWKLVLHKALDVDGINEVLSAQSNSSEICSSYKSSRAHFEAGMVINRIDPYASNLTKFFISMYDAHGKIVAETQIPRPFAPILKNKKNKPLPNALVVETSQGLLSISFP